MKKSIMSILLVCAVLISAVVNGCGGAGDSYPSATTPSENVAGVAAAGAPIIGTVTLRDSSVPAKIRTTMTRSDGWYQFQVKGLQPPFVVKIEWEDGQAAKLRLHSLAKQQGRANINPLSDVILTGAAGVDDPSVVFDSNDPDAIKAAASQIMAALQSLRTVLAPMFQLYGYDKDPIEDDFKADHTGLDALFDDVRIYVASGMIIVRNKRTNGLIFSAPINDIASGTFYQNNLPVQPGTLSGPTLYANKCAGCHGDLAASGKRGATAGAIQAAIADNMGGMGALSGLTALEVQAIATALATATPPPAPTPVDGAALYTSKCGSCHGALTTSSKKGATASAIQSAITANLGGMGSLSTLTADEIAAIAAALATAPAPPPAACTYTYDAWGACRSDGTQIRNVLTSTPAGCTGTPVLTQSCTYVPPVTTCTSFTYSAWGACQPDNTQTRTQLTASPAGCTGGTPVLSQSCTYVPPAQTCGSCHSIPPSTGQHAFHVGSRGLQCSSCHGTGYSSTAVTAATHMNGATNVVSTLNFNAATSTCGSPGCHGSRAW